MFPNFIQKAITNDISIVTPIISIPIKQRISPDLYASFSNLNFAGVYKIGSEVNKKDCYIGSAYNITLKVIHHMNLLYNNKHHSKGLQDWVNENGIEALDISLLSWSKPFPNEFEKLEQYYLDLIKPNFNSVLNKKVITVKTKEEKNIGYYNYKILNEFGKLMVTSFSSHYPNHYPDIIVKSEVDEERKHWTPTICINTESQFSIKRGDTNNLPKKKKFESDKDVTEITIVKRNLGLIGRVAQ
jgi:hypothetical protein